MKYTYKSFLDNQLRLSIFLIILYDNYKKIDNFIILTIESKF